MKYLFLISALYLCSQFSYSQGARIVYFPVDSIHLSNENIDLLQKASATMEQGDKILFRVLIHDDAKNRPAINELDRKRSLELQDYFVSEGFPLSNVKVIKTPGREAKGFISDEMKSLLIYDVEVYKALSPVAFSKSDILVPETGSAESFTVDVNKDYLVKGVKGVQILIPAGCFEFKTGTGVTGPVVFELKEFIRPGEIASAGLMTMNDEFLFHAGAMVWVKATSDGKELRLRKGKTLSMKLPSALTPVEPKLYTGQASNGFIRWTPAEPAVSGTTDAAGICTLPLAALHWIACAGMDKIPDEGSLQVKISVNYNVAIRLILSDQKAVIGAYALPDTKEMNFMHIPVGKKAELVVYGEKDGKVYFFSKSVLTQKDGKEKIQMKESNAAEVKAYLSGLDK
ncbi:MAG: hypothetical protein ACHQRM_17960 [Bacteroidia bacterium]